MTKFNREKINEFPREMHIETGRYNFKAQK